MQTILQSSEKKKIEVVPSAFSLQVLKYSFLQRNSRLWMAVVLGFSDLVSLLLAEAMAVCLRMLIGKGLLAPEFYFRMMPLTAVFLIMYIGRGLYPAIGLNPAEELKSITTSTTLVFLAFAAFTFAFRTSEYYSRLVIFFSWLFAIGFVPLGRWIIRSIAVRLGLWGEPVAIVGYKTQGKQILKFLNRNAQFGLRPVVVIDDFYSGEDITSPVPKLNANQLRDGTKFLEKAGIRTAILVTSELPQKLQEIIIDEKKLGFRHLILIQNLYWISSLAVKPYDLQGLLGLEVPRNLLNTWERLFKRILDIILILVSLEFSIPVFLFLMLLIRLDSRGDIFYGHTRIGRDGRKFKAWKFRTMIPDADFRLDEHLQNRPELRAEWEASQKLKNDPRVTRIGKILRKTSLDELPQLWNVLAGEMSLVGPRPIVDEEVKYYDNSFSLYKKVLPGMTGLWQVSGRNDVKYETRVRLDEYYVRNWSIWIDIIILFRTVWVVFKGDGAY